MTVCVAARLGTVRGRVAPDGVASFLGIPYAAPPFDPCRFREPGPPKPWIGVRDATVYRRPRPTRPRCQHVFDGDAVDGEEPVRPLPEGDRAVPAFVGQDLAVGQAGVVVNSGVDLLKLNV